MTYTTQWFERYRLELHPENTAPYTVMLGRIGEERLLQLGRDWRAEPAATAPQPGCLWFAETQHTVCDQAAGLGFKTFWEQHGLEFDGQPGSSYAESLALFGLPLTEPQLETNSSGDTVLTQWFERARFEWHPANPDAFKVLLGRLGAEVANAPDRFESSATLNGGQVAIAHSRLQGVELWRADTQAGPWTLVRDIWPGPQGSLESYTVGLVVVGGQVFFAPDDGVHGRELWRSDGTAAGTQLVKDIWPGDSGSISVFWPNHGAAELNGQLLFDSNDGVHGRELWRSDGTAAGTQLVKDIRPGPASADVRPRSAVNGVVLVQADDGVHGVELWRSDGTAAGTELLKDINPGAASAAYACNRPCSINTLTVGNLAFLNPTDGVHGVELWRSDGTAAGTQLVKDIWPGPQQSYPFDFALTDGVFTFTAESPGFGRTLWQSDGTAAGTVMR